MIKLITESGDRTAPNRRCALDRSQNKGWRLWGFSPSADSPLWQARHPL
jgi:hypothetical protein